uniref:Odorant-binding protein 34 n=1 Tax=Bradysia odoriphaga TaxID=1564500 RepID=A0A2S0X9I9_9DIPT|nr:odorant-binding protein 34 [Bradysia odoriphaga]
MIAKLLHLSVLVTIISAKVDPICKLAAPTGVDPESCCKVPDILDHPTLEKCAIAVFNTNSSDVSSEVINVGSGKCLFECIFKEHGILKNGTVLPDVALKLLKEVIKSDEVWIPIVTNAIDTCQSMAASMPEKTMSPGTCDSLPAFYFGCFHTQLFKNCPNAKWTASEGCNQLKQNSEKCPVLTAVVSME